MRIFIPVKINLKMGERDGMALMDSQAEVKIVKKNILPVGTETWDIGLVQADRTRKKNAKKVKKKYLLRSAKKQW
jgi:hypothetical protein